ncbi:MAG TPA: hypothetical protein VH475_02235 [Tepidisphaeraceae bacterium]
MKETKPVVPAQRPAPLTAAFHADPISPAVPAAPAVEHANVLTGSRTVKRRNGSQPVQVFANTSRVTAANVAKPAPVKTDDVVARRVTTASSREVFNATPVTAPAIGRLKAPKSDEAPVWR